MRQQKGMDLFVCVSKMDIMSKSIQVKSSNWLLFMGGVCSVFSGFSCL